MVQPYAECESNDSGRLAPKNNGEQKPGLRPRVALHVKFHFAPKGVLGPEESVTSKSIPDLPGARALPVARLCSYPAVRRVDSIRYAEVLRYSICPLQL